MHRLKPHKKNVPHSHDLPYVHQTSGTKKQPTFKNQGMRSTLNHSNPTALVVRIKSLILSHAHDSPSPPRGHARLLIFPPCPRMSASSGGTSSQWRTAGAGSIPDRPRFSHLGFSPIINSSCLARMWHHCHIYQSCTSSVSLRTRGVSVLGCVRVV
jgi:hypothetical protein